MAQSNKFKLKKILEISENEYLLICSLNEIEQKVAVKIECEKPIFGVNFPDNLMLALRSFPPQTVPKIVEKIKNFHTALKFTKELQAA